jgi:putative transposase
LQASVKVRETRAERIRMDTLTPKDRAEAVALFRSEIIGALSRRQLSRGQLRAALRELSQLRFRLPGGDTTRSFSVPTLERWYYAYRAGGLGALRPRPRSDRGRALALAPEQRTLLCDIRREYPSASAALIIRTLVADGRLPAAALSPATLRRLFTQEGLDRIGLRDGATGKTRLRWQAERPGALWHGDVCYGPSLLIDGQSRPLRIHGLLDDASRFVVGLEAHHSEKEIDMLGLLVAALRRHGPPDALYLDNGSTYRGEVLRLGCERLGITLLHARPGDAPARGKMERFWRTLREGCLDFIGALTSLHDVQVRLGAFLDQHYHVAPHASLMGRAPGAVWLAAQAERPADELTETKLRDALTVRERRRVRRDTTVSANGTDWELDQGFLAGRIVTVARSLVGDAVPWVEHDGKRLALHVVDPVANSRRKRPRKRRDQPVPTVDFDPPKALLDQAVGRRRSKDRSR